MAPVAGGEMEAVDAVGEKAAAVEGMDATVKTRPRVLSPLERIELPTGACLGQVFARGWKGRRQRIVVGPAELKERFSRWYNKHHSRRGTLWMERFRSVLVEDGEALRTMR